MQNGKKLTTSTMMKYKPYKVKEKPTTKICPNCKSKKLVHLRSRNQKVCNNCDTKIPWDLDSGQKPLV